MATPLVILALDIDGIFHPEGCSPDEEWVHLERFEEAMRKVPEVSIVISSMWRTHNGIEALRSHFAEDIASRIIDVTPDLYTPELTYARGLRQREIEAWIDTNAPGARWLALDDRKGFFDEDCPHLLLVPHVDEGGTGLEPEHAEELVARLRALLRR